MYVHISHVPVKYISFLHKKKKKMHRKSTDRVEVICLKPKSG